MAHPLLDRERIDEIPHGYLTRIGEVFTTFGQQDSGNISYGVQVGTERYFVKTAGDPSDSRPSALDHAGRVALLRNAVRLSTEVRHPVLTTLRGVIESPAGPMLAYAWADGELLGVPRKRREDPASSFQRFRALPPDTIALVLDQIIDLHDELAAHGWIASDFYDGCLIYDFAEQRLTVMDLDTYAKGVFRNEMGRMFGSTRFMAPEEFERGAVIDERTTVFTLGRTISVFLSDGTLAAKPFRGERRPFDVMSLACQDDPERRYPSVAEFARAWRAARSAAASSPVGG